MEGQEIKAVPSAPRHTGQVVDIFAALKKSFETTERPAAESLRFESSEKGRLNDWHRASLRRVRTGSASPSSSHCRMAGAGPSGATGSHRCKLAATASQRAAQLNRVGHHRVSPALGSGLFARVKVVTRTANIKTASLCRGGNSAAVRALFMIANIRASSSLTAHEKKLTSGHRVC